MIFFLVCLEKWIQSGILQTVQQIGIEMHTTSENIKAQNTNYNKLVTVWKKILSKEEHNFNLVYYNPNLCPSKLRDNMRTYYSYHDILFVKK